MNCQFCFTGRMGLLGNLNPAQIVEQVVFARRLLHEERVAGGGSSTPITTATNIGACMLLCACAGLVWCCGAVSGARWFPVPG